MQIQNEASRHRRRHSRHLSNLSAAGISSMSFDIDESEEPLVAGHNRKQSFHEIPSSLAWSMSDGFMDDEVEEEDEDDRDARERLLSEGDVRRDRLMTEDDNCYCYQTNQREIENYSVSLLDNGVPSDNDDTAENGEKMHAESVEKEVKGSIHDPKLASCFRGLVGSCPEMPTLDDSLLDHSEKVDLILRRARAFSEDNDQVYRRRSSMDSSNHSDSVRQFGRNDSMILDSKFVDSNSYMESPTCVWVYWEENLETSASSPFMNAFLPQQF